jgi:LacI family transcriptional regulator, gluconate utilization system Gnt-I transcriptional repressor
MSAKQVATKSKSIATGATARQSVTAKTPVRQQRRSTLSDVARLARVGTMTVSRALNQPQMVSAELRERINQAVQELGYIPNKVAGGLASGKALSIPVILPTFYHSVYVPLLEGLYSVLPEQGYQILLGTTEYRVDKEEELVSAFLGWWPDGMIVSGVDHSERTRTMIARTGVPVVEVMDLSDNPLELNVGFSHYQVGVEVAKYLAKKGYRHIAYAGTLTEIDFRSVRRIDAFQKTLRKLGLPYDYIERSHKPSSFALGREMLSNLLERHKKLDAIFFANDDLAAGALFECQRRKIKVPSQLALMGFNDQDIAAETVPALTSVWTPRFEMGRKAAEMLLARLRGQMPLQTQVDMGFKIIERKST